MRNKYSKEFENFVRNNVSKYTKEELRELIQNKYNISLSNDALRRYLNRHKIKDKYIDYKKYNVRDVYVCPLGTEHITTEGATYIKVALPDCWRRKSRVMYEKYNRCKLNNDDYILFLNQNQSDFSKDNLLKSSRNEIAYLHNNKTFSKNPKLTELGILSAKLMKKAKERSLTNE